MGGTRYFSTGSSSSTTPATLSTVEKPLIKPKVEMIASSSKVVKYRKEERKKWLKKKKLKKDEKYPGPAPLSKSSIAKHSRGKGSLTDEIKTGIRKAKHMQKEKKIQAGVEHAVRSEVLLFEESGAIEVEDGEHTLQLKQFDIRKKVDIASATKGFHLSLEQFGPYTHRYTNNGRYLALGGRKGHIAAFDWVTKRLMCEFGVKESIHDIVWLHNENMLAVAQKEWTFIYDNQGIEIHCLKSMDRVMKLDFLPYHFLLVGGHHSGFLSWVDVSIGKIVAQFNARQGPVGLMTTNSANAIVHCGHTNGTVTLWAPTVRKPLASILCHGCPLSAIAIDNAGRLMATNGRDGSLRIWDLRNSFAPLSSIKVGVATGLNFSQRGLLAMGSYREALIYAEVGYKQKPYLKHVTNSLVNSISFCPFEDILGVGTDKGFDSVIIPGAGEPNYDALERNPFQTKNQRREAEVKALLEKIQPELIALDNNIMGEIDTEAVTNILETKPKYVKKADIQLAHRKKRKNAKIPKIKEALRSELAIRIAKDQEQSQKREGKKSKVVQLSGDDPLARFVKKTK